MDMSHRLSTKTRALLAVVCIGGALGAGACTTTEASPDGGSGGMGGGAGMGGGGTIGTGDTDGVECPKPATALITDFTYDTTNAATTTATVHFGDSTTLGGGEFVYPTAGDYAVTSDVTASSWHISGNLGDYSGFGLYFDNCTRVDASAYQGIQFTISGSVPSGDKVTMTIPTLNNTVAWSWLKDHGGMPPADSTSTPPGRCIPKTTDPSATQYSQTDCKAAEKAIPVTATPTVVKVMWTDLVGGSPEPNVTPTDITAIAWYFPAPNGVPYMADITIDDLSFIP
jgi:hypothetical protein